MEWIEAIESRRSIRAFTPRPVEDGLVEQILRAGCLAPSAKNRQPWRFVVVRGVAKPAMLQAMEAGLQAEEERFALLPGSRRMVYSARHTLQVMQQAPVTVFIVDNTTKRLAMPQSIEDKMAGMANLQSIGAAIQNMTLAATGLGLGSLWICDIFFAYEAICDYLQADHDVAAALSLGYAAEAPDPRPRKPVEAVTTWLG